MATTAHPSETAGYQPTTDEKFLLVHGWNMEGWEKRRGAETAFKRLWWQGYQGSVALFDWPTLHGFDGWWDVTVDSRHFDNSEFIAWQSAESLAKVLTELNGGGTLRVMAHSMGNVAMAEALRKYTGTPLHTYIADKAAVSAQYYDARWLNGARQQSTVRTPRTLWATLRQVTPAPSRTCFVLCGVLLAASTTTILMTML